MYTRYVAHPPCDVIVIKNLIKINIIESLGIEKILSLWFDRITGWKIWLFMTLKLYMTFIWLNMIIWFMTFFFRINYTCIGLSRQKIWLSSMKNHTKLWLVIKKSMTFNDTWPGRHPEKGSWWLVTFQFTHLLNPSGRANHHLPLEVSKSQFSKIAYIRKWPQIPDKWLH